MRAIRNDGRVALSVDYEQEPYAFALIEGTASVSEDADELLRWSTRIAARYIGEEKAAEYSETNVPSGEILVRVKPTRILGEGHADNEQHMPTSSSVLEIASFPRKTRG